MPIKPGDRVVGITRGYVHEVIRVTETRALIQLLPAECDRSIRAWARQHIKGLKSKGLRWERLDVLSVLPTEEELKAKAEKEQADDAEWARRNLVAQLQTKAARAFVDRVSTLVLTHVKAAEQDRPDLQATFNEIAQVAIHEFMNALGYKEWTELPGERHWIDLAADTPPAEALAQRFRRRE